MPDIISDGNTRVFWVTTIANTSSPTAAELNAGILLHSTMTPDGLAGFQPTTADVPNRKLDSTFNTVDAGSVSYSGNPELHFYKQSGTDTIYDTLTRNTAGFVAVRRSLLASTTWIAAQKAEIYPAKCGEVSKMDPVQDTEEMYAVPIKITSQPVLRATVA